MRYVKIAIFSKIITSEKDYALMKRSAHDSMIAYFENITHHLIYTTDDAIEKFNVVIVPYGNNYRIGVIVDCNVDQSNLDENVNYKSIIKVIDHNIYN